VVANNLRDGKNLFFSEAPRFLKIWLENLFSREERAKKMKEIYFLFS